MVQQPCGNTPKRPQYLVEKSFPQQNGEKVEKLLTEKSEKSLQKTAKNAWQNVILCDILLNCKPVPILGPEIPHHRGRVFTEDTKPWRELFSPRSVSARKFMAFWPAWAPRTAVRSSMLAVQRAARAWLSDLSPRGNGSAQNWTCAKDRWYWIGGLLFYPIVRFN